MTKYKSGLEERFAKLRPDLKYEPFKLNYVSNHTYTPDFAVSPMNERAGKTTVYETKGRFRDSREAAKYVAIQESNPNMHLIFVFSDALLPMPGAQRRKDGTKRTHGEWAESNGFEYFECLNPNKKRRTYK